MDKYFIQNKEGLIWCENKDIGYWSNTSYSTPERVVNNWIVVTWLASRMKRSGLEVRIRKLMKE